MFCRNCNKETMNPKFCSRSCSTSYNNKLYPKREPEGTCQVCSSPCFSSRKLCVSCWTISKEESQKKRDNVTLGEIKGMGNANQNSRYPWIREDARKKYIKSGRPLICAVCSYSLHVDICHISPISSFNLDTRLLIINRIENLVALCKNHHWELDHGYLESVALST